MSFKHDIIVLISFLILFVSISFLVNIGKELSLSGFRKYPLMKLLLKALPDDIRASAVL